MSESQLIKWSIPPSRQYLFGTHATPPFLFVVVFVIPSWLALLVALVVGLDIQMVAKVVLRMLLAGIVVVVFSVLVEWLGVRIQKNIVRLDEDGITIGPPRKAKLVTWQNVTTVKIVSNDYGRFLEINYRKSPTESTTCRVAIAKEIELEALENWLSRVTVLVQRNRSPKPL